MLESNLILVLAIELRLGIDPSRACSPPWRGLPPAVARLVLRTAFLSLQVGATACDAMLIAVCVWTYMAYVTYMSNVV